MGGLTNPHQVINIRTLHPQNVAIQRRSDDVEVSHRRLKQIAPLLQTPHDRKALLLRPITSADNLSEMSKKAEKGSRPSTAGQLLSLPPQWLAAYDDFVTKNAGQVSQIESALRSLTYIIPGMTCSRDVSSVPRTDVAHRPFPGCRNRV